MASRLDCIVDWKRAARQAGYQVHTLARRVGVTDRQLERYFCARRGRMPKAWLDDLRMADAVRYLRRGWMVKQVAERLAYKHLQDLTRAFARVHGIAPSEWRAIAPRRSIKVNPMVRISGPSLLPPSGE